MQIFALETNYDKLKQQFLSPDEEEIMTVRFHWFRFFIAVIREIFWTVVLVAAAIGLTIAHVPPFWLWVFCTIIWVIFVFFPILRSYIDWRYDAVLITTDKVIVIDQSSLFKRKVTPMNLENLASATAETQFWNLFSFGILHFSLKEGSGDTVRLSYVPYASVVASTISDAFTMFQRRKDLRRYGQEECPVENVKESNEGGTS